MQDRNPRRRRSTIIKQLTPEEQAHLADLAAKTKAHSHPSPPGPIALPQLLTKRYPPPEVFKAGPIASIQIDRLGSLSTYNEPFLGDMDQQVAAALIKAIARHADIHPDAVADFIDDITQVEPE